MTTHHDHESPKHLYARIREVLIADWDPMGLSDAATPPDDYDDVAREVHASLPFILRLQADGSLHLGVRERGARQVVQHPGAGDRVGGRKGGPAGDHHRHHGEKALRGEAA